MHYRGKATSALTYAPPPLHRSIWSLFGWFLVLPVRQKQERKEGPSLRMMTTLLFLFLFLVLLLLFFVSADGLMKLSATTILTHVETIDGLIDCLLSDWLVYQQLKWLSLSISYRLCLLYDVFTFHFIDVWCLPLTALTLAATTPYSSICSY